MAMFDKTFPTLDCAACILTPKMVAVDQHEHIVLMTNSEVEEVGGEPGAYSVKVRRKARRVVAKDCIACDLCAQVCPARVLSDFDNGIAERKAAYIAFPQAVPNAYLIDAEACTYVQSGGAKCGVCAKKCPKECIDLDQADEVIELTVGNIVLTTGYDLYDAAKVERYGYGTLPNVLTSLEFERLTNASGPTSGKIVMKALRHSKRTKSDEWLFDAEEGSPPKSVAIIHCVGSRDANHNEYCSRVCCMYSLKFAHLVREKLPDAICHEFYIDMRAFGKGYEEFAERIKAEGTHVVRGRTAKVVEEDGHMVIKGEDIISESMIDMPVDMVDPGGRPCPCRRIRRAGRPPAHRHGPRRLVQRARLQLRPHRHGTRRDLRRRRLPGAEGHPGHGGTGLGGRRGRPQEHRHRARRQQRRRPVTGRHRGASRTPGPGLRRGTHGHTSQPQAYRRTGSLRRPGREQVLSLRQLLGVVPVLQGARISSRAAPCAHCRWGWRRSSRATSSPGSATTAASVRRIARAAPSPVRP